MVVSIYIRITLPDGRRRYARPIYSSNSKLRPFYALVDGREERHPEGVYHLRYTRQGKNVWENVGSDPQVAMTRHIRREREINARESGLVVVEDTYANSGRPMLLAIREYLQEVNIAKAAKTYCAYKATLEEFAQTQHRDTTLESLDRRTILNFIELMRKRGIAPRTMFNRITYLRTFFLHFGLKWPMLRTDRITYTKKHVDTYSPEELQRLFAVASVDETDLFQFFLCTGAREREVVYATWADIDFSRCVFHVREKRDLGFIPKDKEEGASPIPTFLAERLRARRERYPKSQLIFGRPDGRPDGHFLRTLHLLALKAGINCGECYSKKGQNCSTHPICKHVILHKFRRTFATRHSDAGVPVRTIQRWLRHSSLDTTLRYLANTDDQSELVRTKVNTSFSDVLTETEKL